MTRVQHSPIVASAFIASVALHAFGALAFVVARQPSVRADAARAAKEIFVPVDEEEDAQPEQTALVGAEAAAPAGAANRPEPPVAVRAVAVAAPRVLEAAPAPEPSKDPVDAVPTVQAPARIAFASTFTLSTHGATNPAATGVTGVTAGAASFDDAVAENRVSVPARLLGSAAVAYPVAAREAEVEADVPVQIVVDVGGHVVEAHALTSAGYGFPDAAVRAVRGYRFSPAQKDGHAVRVRMRWVVQFRLR